MPVRASSTCSTAAGPDWPGGTRASPQKENSTCQRQSTAVTRVVIAAGVIRRPAAP
ncbi:hypothetical protein ACFFX0_32060 [Citricoccus parietis]|uniref:Uncharacterized protein n=1 Tax=Citricoccus parietis TaxID=592307 RepID=A0ABV5G9D6_9MICC